MELSPAFLSSSKSSFSFSLLFSLILMLFVSLFFIIPAQALRGFANGSFPSAIRRLLWELKVLVGQNSSPRISMVPFSMLSCFGTALLMRISDVMLSPCLPSPRDSTRSSFPLVYRADMEMPSILGSTIIGSEVSGSVFRSSFLRLCQFVSCSRGGVGCPLLFFWLGEIFSRDSIGVLCLTRWKPSERFVPGALLIRSPIGRLMVFASSSYLSQRSSKAESEISGFPAL